MRRRRNASSRGTLDARADSARADSSLLEGSLYTLGRNRERCNRNIMERLTDGWDCSAGVMVGGNGWGFGGCDMNQCLPRGEM